MSADPHTNLFTQVDHTKDPDFFVRFMDEAQKPAAIQVSKRLMQSRPMRAGSSSQLCSGTPARAMNAPTAPAPRRTGTIPRHSGTSRMSAAARTAYCHGSVSALVREIAEPRMAPIAAGPAPSRNARALLSLLSRSNQRPPSSMNAKDGVKATTDASKPPPKPAAA
jgi:hypothetical protein